MLGLKKAIPLWTNHFKACSSFFFLPKAEFAPIIVASNQHFLKNAPLKLVPLVTNLIFHEDKICQMFQWSPRIFMDHFHSKAKKKKYMCVSGFIPRKNRVGRSDLIFYFFLKFY